MSKNAVEAILSGIEIGAGVSYSKTVSESDVYAFAGITGDLAPNHVDEEYMKRSVYGRRIAHGVLVLGLASTATWMFASRHDAPGASLGYDAVRFLKPVFFGDTITIDYRIAEIDAARARIYADVKGTNQRRETVLSARHIIKVLPQSDDGVAVCGTPRW